MVSEAPHNHDLFEVDEPTHPFSRGEIDRLRRMADLEPFPEHAQGPDAENPEIANLSTRSPLAVVPSVETMSERPSNDGARGEEEWFELDGRWLRVSLQSFAHFGLNGAPPGMIGSVDASFISGAINWQDGAPFRALPRLTEVYVAPEPEPEPEPAKSQPSSRLDKRWRWVGLVASLVGLVLLVAWIFPRAGVEPEQPRILDVRPTPVADPPAASPPATIADLPKPDSESEEAEDDTGEILLVLDEEPRKEKSRKSPAQSDACVEHRKLATRAHEGGKWVLLEELTQRRNCWARTSEAKALQMRALFELERFRECVQLGAQGGSKEVEKWVSNCQRALE